MAKTRQFNIQIFIYYLIYLGATKVCNACSFTKFQDISKSILPSPKWTEHSAQS